MTFGEMTALSLYSGSIPGSFTLIKKVGKVPSTVVAKEDHILGVIHSI